MSEYTFNELMDGLNSAVEAGNSEAANQISDILEKNFPEETGKITSSTQLEEDKGWLDSAAEAVGGAYDTVKDVVTGESMRTELSDDTPVVSGGLGQILPGTDSLDDFAGVDASGPATWFASAMTTDMDELADIYVSKTQGKVRKGLDEKGNIYLVNNETGEIRAMNTPGLDLSDIGQFGANAAAFTPAGRFTKGVAAAIGANAATQGVIEGIESQIGGSTDASEIVAAGLLGGAVPVASNIAKGAKGKINQLMGKDAPIESLSNFDRTKEITKITPRSGDQVGLPLSRSASEQRIRETNQSWKERTEQYPSSGKAVGQDIKSSLNNMKKEAVSIEKQVLDMAEAEDAIKAEPFVGKVSKRIENIDKEIELIKSQPQNMFTSDNRNLKIEKLQIKKNNILGGKIRFNKQRERNKREFLKSAQNQFNEINFNKNIGKKEKISSLAKDDFTKMHNAAIRNIKNANSFASLHQAVKSYNQGMQAIFSKEGKLSGLNADQFNVTKTKGLMKELLRKDIQDNLGDGTLDLYDNSQELFSKRYKMIDELGSAGIKKDVNELSSVNVAKIFSSGDETKMKNVVKAFSKKGLRNVTGIMMEEAGKKSNGNPLKLAQQIRDGLSTTGGEKGWMLQTMPKSKQVEMKRLADHLEKFQAGDSSIEPYNIQAKAFRILSKTIFDSEVASRAVWSGFGSKKEYIKNKSINDMILEITAQAARQSDGE